MKNRYRIIVFTVILLLSCAGCNKQIEKDVDIQTKSVETKRQEPLSVTQEEKNGTIFVQKQYVQYQIRYPLLDKEIVSEEKVKDFMLKGGKTVYSKKENHDDGSTTEYVLCGNNIQIPEIFDQDTVSKVTYTLYNFAGGLALEEYPFSTDELKLIDQSSVEILGGQPQTLYLFFCIAAQSDSEVDKYYNDYKEDLMAAIIKAEVTDLEGEEKTVYFGVRQKYETSDTAAYLQLYTLEIGT